MSIQPRLHVYLLFLLISLAVGSCGNEETKHDLPDTDSSTLVDANTGLDKQNYMRLQFGSFLAVPGGGVPITNRQDLVNSMQHLSNTDSSLVIYFHGGVIPLKRAFRDPLQTGLDARFREASGFPYYILYGGGPGELIWTYLFNRHADEPELAEEELSPLDTALEKAFKRKSFLYLLLQLSRKFGGGSAFALNSYNPVADTNNLETLLRLELSRQDSTQPFRQGVAANQFFQDNFESQLLKDSIFQDLARKDAQEGESLSPVDFAGSNAIKRLFDIPRILKGISSRIRAKRTHGFVMTLTEEVIIQSKGWFLTTIRNLARSGWDQQKADTKDAFKTDPERYGGRALLEELLLLDQQNRQAGRSRKIFLVGSSTGAIMICHLLETAAEPRYRQLRFNLIFSVPSCTVVQAAKAFKKAAAQIESIHLFALSDQNEAHATPALFIYPGSILYLVSALCEHEPNAYHDEILLGMQKFYEDEFIQNPSLSSAERTALGEIRSRLRVSQRRSPLIAWSNEENENSNLVNKAKKHGGVIRDSEVQQSIVYLLRQ